MLIDMTATFKNLDGTPIKENADAQAPAMTLSTAACNALLAIYQDEQNLSGKEKAERYALATKVYVKPGDVVLPIDISVDDVSLIQKLIGKMYSPMVVGQAFKMLDPKPTEVAKSA